MSAPATAAAPVGKAPVTGRAWLVTGMLCLFMIINFADKAVLGLVAQPAMAELGLSPGQWGQIGSAFFFLFAISSIFVGALASYVNTRWLIFGMVIVWSAAQLPVFLGGGFMVLLLTRILLGAGEGPAMSISLHATQNYFPAEKRAFPSNIVSMGASLGAVVAAPVLSIIIAGYGWRWAFGALVVIGLVWGVFWFFIGLEGPFARRGAKGGATVQPAPDGQGDVVADPEAAAEDTLAGSTSGDEETAAGPAASSTELLHLVPVRKVFGSGMWIAAGIAGFCCFWGQAILTTWVPQYIGGVMGVDTARIGLVVALPWLFGAIMLAFLGWLAQRLMSRGYSARLAVGGTFGASLVLGGAALLVLPHTAGVASFVALTLIGAFTVFPMAPTAVGFAVNPRQRALVMATLTGLASVGGIISPMIAGTILQNAGYDAADPSTLPALAEGLNLTLGITGGLLVASGLLAIAFLRPEHARDRLQERHAIRESV